MKKFVVCLFLFVLLFGVVGCSSDNTKLQDGFYFPVGSYAETSTPYLKLNTDEKSFNFGAALIQSFALHGTYEVVDNKIIATSENEIFQFEIKDDGTIVLIDKGNSDYPDVPISTQFIHESKLQF